jgi:hypothetical protein
LFATVTLITAGHTHRRGILNLVDQFGTPKGARARIHAALALGGVLLAFGGYSLVNYAKLGTATGMPLDLYRRYEVFNEMETLRRIEGKPFHLINARMMLYNYFHPWKIRFRPTFPWAFVAEAEDSEPARFPEAKLDLASEFSSFPASQPALLLLAVFGLMAASFIKPASPRVQLRLPLVGALAAGTLIFLFINIAQRYVHDFYPFLLIAAAAGLHWVQTIRARPVRCATYIILVPLAVYSMYVNTAFALVHQRETTHAYGNPWFEAKAEEFNRWRTRIDDWVASWQR